MKRVTELATAFDAVKVSLGQDIVWLQSLREVAAHHFKQQGLPAKKEEDWKYTSLWGLGQVEWVHTPVSSTVTPDEVAAAKQLNDASCLVFVDGVYIAAHSNVEGIPTGATVKPLSESLALPAVATHFGQQALIDAPGLTALNTMLVSEGAVIILDDDVAVDKPIELVFINTANTENLATHLHNLVVVGEGSAAEIIETHIGLTDVAYFANQITEVVLAADSYLKHYVVQQASKAAFQITHLSAKQAENSIWQTHSVALGGLLARQDLHTQLLGETAHCVMDGLYLPRGEQHIDNHTRVDHAVPNTTSEELYKGVLDDQGRAVFNGKVIVHKDAQKTDAKQQNANLLLSRRCEIDTKPQMEIYADDVTCSHGSTVGQLDEAQLFFLRARGLSELEARNLLTYAFVSEVIDQVALPELRTSLTTLVEANMPGVEVRSTL